MNEKKEIRFIDLFGGIGGFRYGLERCNSNRKLLQKQKGTPTQAITNTQRGSTRFTCVWYCDKDKYSVQTYNKNFKEDYEPTDITIIQPRDIPDFDLLCAGFPCQSFSIAGKRKGFKDTRGTLFFEIVRIAKVKRPAYLFLENVKGLLNHEKGKTFTTIIQTLGELGYGVQWMVLNSKFFGVPQNRERVFIIGHLGKPSRPQIFPIRENDEVYPGKNTSQSSCLRSPLRCQGDKPMIIHNVYGGFNEGIRKFEDYSPAIRTPKGGGHLPMVAQALQTDEQLRQGSSWENNNPQSKRNIRRLTPIECERLQGFPDNWTKGVSDTQRYKQCGNAVTVNVIEAIGKKILISYC